VKREIRLYVEGGGDQKDTKGRLRMAFGKFLREIKGRARSKHIEWTIVACGSRFSTFENFRLALRSHPEAVNLLLVDAEGPVRHASPWEHLRTRKGDEWKNPGAEDHQCHLMIQCMETWLLCDPEELAAYYGQGFREKALPKSADIEGVPKESVFRGLKEATRATKTKGEYHKTQHAPEILERIRAGEVRKKAPACDRLFVAMIHEIDR
jgi:hypothetical protein